MAKVTLSQYRNRQFGGAAGAYGNTTSLVFRLLTNAIGAAVGSDQATALVIGDVVDMGPLPAGLRLDDSQAIISDAFTASVTCSLGFAYEDGEDSAEVPQDAAYFGTGLSLAAAARLRNAVAKAPVVLPKPARLILTVAGANNAVAGQVDVLVQGELTGAR